MLYLLGDSSQWFLYFKRLFIQSFTHLKVSDTLVKLTFIQVMMAKIGDKALLY